MPVCFISIITLENTNARVHNTSQIAYVSVFSCLDRQRFETLVCDVFFQSELLRYASAQVRVYTAVECVRQVCSRPAVNAGVHARQYIRDITEELWPRHVS